MKSLELIVKKAEVYDEVAKTTSYTGAKMANDAGAYDRIFTTDDDRVMLERFWTEACNAVTERMKPFVVNVSGSPRSRSVDLANDYKVTLELPSAFCGHLAQGISAGLFSFFVASIVAKWYKFTNKNEVEAYATEAVAAIEEVMKKIYYRQMPERAIPI